MPEPRNRALSGAVAAAAIPAVVLTGFGAAAPAAAAEVPALGTTLTPKLATHANVQAAQQRIAAHLVAAQVPSRLTVAASAQKSVAVRSGDTLSHISIRHDVALSTLLKANNLKSTSVIHPGQKIKLSTGSTTKSTASKKSSSSGASSTAGRYTVVSGDTLSGVAMRRGMGLSVLLKANGLNMRSVIHPGQKLRVSGAGPSESSPSTSTSPKASASSASKSTKTYTVAAGDTLSGIAQRHGMGLSVLLKTNKIGSGSTIHPGKKLTLSGSTAAKPASSAPRAATSTKSASGSYTVASGDTLSGIAAKKNMPLSALLSANGIKSTSVIHPGQKLKVSGTSSVSSTSSARKQLVPSTFLHYTYPKATVASANENKHTLLSGDLPSRAAMKRIVADTATKMGVDPSLALAHAYQESGFNMAAVSPANAIGAMQVIPSSGEWASQLVGRDLDLLNPYDNATAGVAIIRSLHRTSPSKSDAIAGYYQGAGSVKRNGMYNDTKRYVRSILAHQKSFK
ncbi:LysM peptidoglycan-binding domain-containing protein [Arthrobacter sp. KK5.5]|uniref:LysM peptidoglycan-binding domain-containing protein n=1 Tax=Arthrobacter sp. KK5.5 TaxID=3373084 RepID=UPI003EE78E6E